MLQCSSRPYNPATSAASNKHVCWKWTQQIVCEESNEGKRNEQNVRAHVPHIHALKPPVSLTHGAPNSLHCPPHAEACSPPHKLNAGHAVTTTIH